MDSEHEDIALNSRLWGYRVGTSNQRHKKLVIRIRFSEEHTKTSRGANTTLERLKADDSDAGGEFGPQELETGPAHIDELVVVVGEFLPEDIAPTQPVVPRSMPMSANDFKPDVHNIVPSHPGSRVFVRKLKTQRTGFFVLVDKKDGLCEIAQLPATVSDTRLVYYPEWTDGKPRVAHRDRAVDWKQNIAKFCTEYLINRASSAPGAPAQAESPRDTVRQQAIDSVKRPLGEGKAPDESSAIDLLFTKPTEIDNKTASEITEILSRIFAHKGAPMQPSASCIQSLARGLEELGSRLDVAPHEYLPTLAIFCLGWGTDGQTHDDDAVAKYALCAHSIAQTMDTAVLLGRRGGLPPSPVPDVTEEGGSRVSLGCENGNGAMTRTGTRMVGEKRKDMPTTGGWGCQGPTKTARRE